MTSQVFVSYSRDDSQFVRRLVDDLTNRGVDIWLDVRDILASERWDSEVQEALRESDFFMIVLSPTSAGSENVQDEIAYALSKKKRVFPILYQDCDIPFRLARVQYVDFRQDYPAGLDLLLEQMAIFGVPISAEPRSAPTAGEQPPAPGETTPRNRRQPPDRGGGGLKASLAKLPIWGWAAAAVVLLSLVLVITFAWNGEPPPETPTVTPPPRITETNTPEASAPEITITPGETPVSSDTPTVSLTAVGSPSPTSSPSPTYDPFLSRGDCVDHAPPCDYTVFPLDSFTKIAIKIYGREDLTPLLMNANRDADGYRIKLDPGQVIPIPDPELTISDLAKHAYPRCGPNVFPCWYEAQAGVSYDSLATIFYGKPAAVKAIQNANWAFDASQPTHVVTPVITPGMLMVLPVVH